MVDFNKILDAGDVDAGEINVVVEIPTGSNHKIEWNRKLACFELDRVEPAIFAKPCNYGFIPQTLDEDGDELDALIITEQPLTTGIFLKAKVIGVMKFVDDGEVDVRNLENVVGEVAFEDALPILVSVGSPNELLMAARTVSGF